MIYHRACLFILAVILLAESVANAQTTVCTGYPKMYNGLPCASTTRYWDGQMGACGCGTGGSSPFSFQWTKLTAAASAPIFGAGTWCGTGCGRCFRLTPTAVGTSPQGTGATSTTSYIAKVTNLCPYTGNEQWCAYDINSFGYDAHFDLMDYNMDGLVTSMGWNNPEVTYEEVDCATNGYADWGCECASANYNGTSVSAVPIAATAAPVTATAAPVIATAAPVIATAAPATSAPKATTAPAKATTAPSKATTAPEATTAPSKATTAPPKATTPAVAATTPAVAETTPAVATSTVKIQVNAGSNAWWFGFSIVGTNDISKVEIMDNNSAVLSWTAMTYQGDNTFWNMYSYNSPQAMATPLSLRFTSASGQVSIATNIITSFQSVVVDTKLTV